MANIKEAFLLTTLAGLSTLLGSIFIFLKRKDSSNVICEALAFAAGVMMTVSLTDLIPEGQNLLLKYFYQVPTILISFIFLVIGIILSMIIDYCLPEKNNSNKSNNKLYRVGIISMLAIILHNLPEGIATFMTSTNNISLGISLTIAIALHNITEGISISIPIFYASGSHKKAFFYTFISGISELIGAIIAYFFLKDIMNDAIMGMLYSVIAGIMIHISFSELLPTSLQYKKEYSTIIYFILGVSVMLINHFYF